MSRQASGPTLAKIWDNQFAGQSDGLAKEAAAHGMTPDQYIRAVAQSRAKEEQRKVAEERNNKAIGILLNSGFEQGIKDVFTKYASAGGNVNAAQALTNHFTS